jgi:hypothetical protein
MGHRCQTDVVDVIAGECVLMVQAMYLCAYQVGWPCNNLTKRTEMKSITTTALHCTLISFP